MKTIQIDPQYNKKSNLNENYVTSTLNEIPPLMVFQLITRCDGKLYFTHLSESVREFYGISPDEGKIDANVIYEKFQQEDISRFIKTGFKAYRKGTTFKKEFRIVNPSGSVRWSYFEAIPTKMKDGSICWDGVEHNITELKLP